MKLQSMRQAKFRRFLVDCTAAQAVFTVWLCILVAGFTGWVS